ncbi:MAG: helix-turn-helix transcriptional regulator [Clostridia bacterium]|nr:helix-turn-helix transcriptional regulator [Clostridia bacterium]
MTFSETFKHYRQQCGYTQEQIARILMVTPQAVSKWETGIGTPDISMLVPIAELFDISTDDLLGRRGESRVELQTAIVEINNNTEDSYENKYQQLQLLLRRNPNNPAIMQRMISFSAEWLIRDKNRLTHEKKDEIVANAKEYADRLSEKFADHGYYSSSHGMLSDVYSAIDDFGRAEHEIGYLSSSRYTKPRLHGNLALRNKLFQEARLSYQESISDSLVWMFWDIERLAQCYRRDDSVTRKRILKLEYDLIRLLYGDDKFTFPLHSYYNTVTIRLAEVAVIDGDHERAFDYLYEHLDVTIASGEGQGEKCETGCILFPDVFPPYHNTDRTRKTSKESMLARLSWRTFDPIREDERFQNIVRTVESWT